VNYFKWTNRSKNKTAVRGPVRVVSQAFVMRLRFETMVELCKKAKNELRGWPRPVIFWIVAMRFSGF
jgi:hypothetical protein